MKKTENKILLGVWGYGERARMCLKVPLFIRHAALGKSFVSVRIPPLSPTHIGHFDYFPFLLFDKVVVDRESYENVINWYKKPRGKEFPYIHKDAVEILKYLESTGHLLLKNYDDVLEPFAEAIRKQIEIDLFDKNIYHAFNVSLTLWRQFLFRYINISENKGILFLKSKDKIFSSYYQNKGIPWPDPVFEIDCKDLYEQIEAIKKFTDEWFITRELTPNTKILEIKGLREYIPIPSFLREYLLDINSTLVLSNILGEGFYDWNDYSPFYEYKLARAGQIEHKEKKQIGKLSKIFEVFVPEFSITKASYLERLIKDPRIKDLRRFVMESRIEQNKIDLKFYASVQKAVLEIEENIRKYSKVISYVTMPLGFIPWIGTFLEKTVEELLIRRKAKKAREPLSWYYLLRNASKPFSKQDVLQFLKQSV